MKTDWLIVGTGLTGCVLAERIASILGEDVLMLESRSHVGGNVHDAFDSHGVYIHTYGPHLFHTNSELVWNYLSNFTAWRPHEHRVLAEIESTLVPVPFNYTSIDRLFVSSRATRLKEALTEHSGTSQQFTVSALRQHAAAEIRELGEYIYRRVFRDYTSKQWGVPAEQLDPSVLARVPVRASYDDRYFTDRFQAIPANGYSSLVRNLLSSKRIHLMTSADYFDVRAEIDATFTIYTGPIDRFFDYRDGALAYRSLEFRYEHHRCERYQAASQINYPDARPYTRTTEFKLITGQTHAGTTVATEFPVPHVVGRTEPYYPVPSDANQTLYERYRAMAAQLGDKVLFAGRLADYRYYNMDQAVARALMLFEKTVRPAHTARNASCV